MINKQELLGFLPKGKPAATDRSPGDARRIRVLYTATQQRVSVKCSAQPAEEIKVSSSATHSVVCTSRASFMLYKGKCLLHRHARLAFSEFV